MLTYSQIETIAGMLKWTAEEVEAEIANLNAGFMTPYVEEFPMAEPEIGIEEPGIYWRLSASGYMDCTEWSGPFETVEDAVAEMLEMCAE